MKVQDWATRMGIMLVTFALMTQTVLVHRRIDQTRKIAEEFASAKTNLANAYFRAGVSSAMNAHGQYLKRELMEGRRPDLTGAPFEQWRRESYGVWFSNSPEEPLLWREPAVVTNSVVTNVVAIYFRDPPKQAIYKFPE